jgi:hypothetical protein
MLRITYAEHEQLIELAAQSPATASPPQIAESLRRLPGIEGVEVPADPAAPSERAVRGRSLDGRPR